VVGEIDAAATTSFGRDRTVSSLLTVNSARCRRKALECRAKLGVKPVAALGRESVKAEK
jgi:hypothetical protein